MSEIDDLVGVIRAGGLAVLPTDTVYGLVCAATSEQAAADLSRLKGRSEIQPTAVLAASVDALVELIPELDGLTVAIAEALLPGPFTLVVPNPARRLSWLSAIRPDTIGVRVPALAGPAADVLARLGAIAATSANLAGGVDPCRLDDVPAAILAGVAATLDAGELPGTPSTVIDLTGPDPVVLRVGAGDPTTGLARVAAAHTQFLRSRDRPLTEEE